ncbi:MAG: endonuclease [Kistimonas sp.]|nr:endonuclease [Kistimonas sp.]
MRRVFLFSLLISLASGLLAQGAPTSFRAAKKKAALVYRDHQTTFYCGCSYNRHLNAGRSQLIPDLISCGYQVRKQYPRAHRIEWEHVVPAWVFGHQRRCWQHGGRKQCKKDPVFRSMEADLYNLAPAIGEVNGDRSNYGFGLLPRTPDMYGRCQFKVNFKRHMAQPPANKRGAIARIWLYMAAHYHLRLSRQDQKLYSAWNTMYPVRSWEAQRNLRISAIQGWENPFVVQRMALSTDDSRPVIDHPS